MHRKRKAVQTQNPSGGSRGASSPLILLLALAALALVEAGCTRLMVVAPAPTATLVSGRQYMAEASDAGVHVEADGNAWSGNPYELQRIITPMEVKIRNNSGKPLRVAYSDFFLTTASGTRFRVLPPYNIRGKITSAAPVVPAFAYNRFYIAPYYAPFYSWDFDDWDGPFDFDWDYYPTYYAVWRVRLPTRDMVQRAIPEGVLVDGGALGGFLYFQKVDENHRRESLTFGMDLIDAQTQQAFGKISIPFVIK